MTLASNLWFVALPPELEAFATSLGLDVDKLSVRGFVRLIRRAFDATQLLKNEDGSVFRGENGETIRVPDHPVRLAAVKMGFCLHALLQDRPGKPN